MANYDLGRASLYETVLVRIVLPQDKCLCQLPTEARRALLLRHVPKGVVLALVASE